MNYCYAVDLGGTAIKFSLFDEQGNLVEKWQQATKISENGRHILSDIALAILDHIDQNNFSKDQIIGIGVGVPAVVDESGIVNIAPNLGWRQVDVKKKLGEMTGLACYVINDANGAALGEYYCGGGMGNHSMVLLTLGTGVGGGVVMDGRIVTGYEGAAGEMGHICVNDQETVPCNCGSYGCLEQYSSATGLVRSYREFRNMGKDGLLPPDAPIEAKDVFDALEQGDEAAKEALERLGYYLGKACAIIACVIAPEVIVFGGGVSHAGEILISTVQKYFDRFAFPACRKTKFALASAGNDAGIYGCAYLVLKNR